MSNQLQEPIPDREELNSLKRIILDFADSHRGVPIVETFIGSIGFGNLEILKTIKAIIDIYDKCDSSVIETHKYTKGTLDEEFYKLYRSLLKSIFDIKKHSYPKREESEPNNEA